MVELRFLCELAPRPEFPMRIIPKRLPIPPISERDFHLSGFGLDDFRQRLETGDVVPVDGIGNDIERDAGDVVVRGLSESRS